MSGRRLPATGPALREIHAIGGRTREWVLAAETCPQLRERGVFALGITEAREGYRFVRQAPAQCVLIGTLSGTGRVLIDGRFVDAHAGAIYLAPPQAQHAYHVHRSRWTFCWITYTSERGRPVVDLPAPQAVLGDARPLAAAMRGLQGEVVGAAEPAMLHRHIDLVDALARRLSLRWRSDDRLWPLWRLVDGDLGRRWTLTHLAREAGMSAEALRVLCLRRTGRSPMRQVAFLRMQRAANQLLAYDLPLSDIAAALGYDDPFAFSSAFKRAMGVSPSVYRRRSREG